MAQKISEIKQIMVDEKNSITELNDLNSPSKVSIWNLLFHCVAVCIQFFEQLIDQFKIDVQVALDSNYYGTGQWWQREMFKFQLGDQTSIVDNKIQYPLVDETKRIITACAVIDGIDLVIKTAKGESPDFEKLSPSELSAVRGYVSQIRPISQYPQIESFDGDYLYLKATVKYDAQVGEVLSKQATIDAINTYLANLPFNGKLNVNALINEVQKSSYVKDITFEQISFRGNANTFDVNLNAALVRGFDILFSELSGQAGYFIEENTVGYTYDDSLTMIAE